MHVNSIIPFRSPPCSSRNWLVIAVLLLALPQVYALKIAGSYLPLAIIPVLLCIPYLRVMKSDSFFFLSIAMNYLIATISITWSSSTGLWEYYMLFSSIFPICFFFARKLQPGILEFGLKLFVFIASLHSLLIVLFRCEPSLKLAFLVSGALGIFKNPARLVGIENQEALLNVFDPNKSGGLFDNANTAATFTLVAIGVAMAVRNSLPRRLFYLCVALMVIGVFCTGSKSGAFILVGLATAMRIWIEANAGSLLKRILVIYGLLISVVILWFFSDDLHNALQGSTLMRETQKTSEDRINLLRLSIEVIKQHWLFGVGFGGWERIIAGQSSYYGVEPGWPPHNSIAEAWIETGLFGLTTILCAYLAVFKRILHSVQLHVVGASGALFAFIGSATMSLGDPTPMLGAPQYASVLAFAAALVINRSYSIPNAGRSTDSMLSRA